MKFKMTKTKFAAAITAGVMLVPAAAYATHVFDDVPDGAFYAAPVAWAFENGITTGTSATTFAPLDSVTRGESVTFLQRYNDNIVAPALAELEDTVPTIGMTGVSGSVGVSIDSTSAVQLDTLPLPGSGTVDVVANAHVQIENAGSGQGRFAVWLALDGCEGSVISEGGLRTGVTSSTFVNTTVSLTGYIDDVAGDSHIVLCADKVFGGSVDGTAYDLAITAFWS